MFGHDHYHNGRHRVFPIRVTPQLHSPDRIGAKYTRLCRDLPEYPKHAKYEKGNAKKKRLS